MATSNTGAELLTRLNNKLGGYGPLPGARLSSSSSSTSPPTFGADTFRALGSWEGELCDPERGLLAHLTDPASPAFFQNLHRASQERILVALLRVERPCEELAPEIRALVEKLVAIGGDKRCWAPRLIDSVRKKFRLPDSVGVATGPNLIDQDAEKICSLLDPVGGSPFCYAAADGSGADGSSASSEANSTTSSMPGDIEDRIVRGMARLGVLRCFPYSTMLAGTGEGDRVAASAYRASVPGCVQVLMSEEAKLPEADYPFKLKHAVNFSGGNVGIGNAGHPSRGVPAAMRKQDNSSSSSSSSMGAAAGSTHFRDAQDKKNQAISNQTDALLAKLSSSVNDPSKKRPRDYDSSSAAASGAAAMSAPPPAKKMTTAANAPGWDDMNSEHLKRFSDMVAILDSTKNIERKKRLKEKHKLRLQDFAAFPKHTMSAQQGKNFFAIPFQTVMREDGQRQLMALVLYYGGSKAGTFTKKAKDVKRKN